MALRPPRVRSGSFNPKPKAKAVRSGAFPKNAIAFGSGLNDAIDAIAFGFGSGLNDATDAITIAFGFGLNDAIEVSPNGKRHA